MARRRLAVFPHAVLIVAVDVYKDGTAKLAAAYEEIAAARDTRIKEAKIGSVAEPATAHQGGSRSRGDEALPNIVRLRREAEHARAGASSDRTTCVG